MRTLLALQALVVWGCQSPAIRSGGADSASKLIIVRAHEDYLLDGRHVSNVIDTQAHWVSPEVFKRIDLNSSQGVHGTMLLRTETAELREDRFRRFTGLPDETELDIRVTRSDRPGLVNVYYRLQRKKQHTTENEILLPVGAALLLVPSWGQKHEYVLIRVGAPKVD